MNECEFENKQALERLTNIVRSLRIEETIRELSQTMTIVIVTHNMQQAARVSDYTAFFLADNSPGKLIETGVTSVIFDKPEDQRTLDYVNGRFG